MAGRGPQSFKKRQKEQQRKEKQLEKAQKRVERKTNPLGSDRKEELTCSSRSSANPSRVYGRRTRKRKRPTTKRHPEASQIASQV